MENSIKKLYARLVLWMIGLALELAIVPSSWRRAVDDVMAELNAAQESMRQVRGIIQAG